MVEYKCPYCGQDSYLKKSKGKFLDWKAVRAHTTHCKLNNKEYIIDLNMGSIHYLQFVNLTYKEILNKLPNLKSSLTDIRRAITKKEIICIKPYREYKNWDKESILNKIKYFFIENNRIPTSRDFDKNTNIFPCVSTVKQYFNSWNAAIIAAGFEPNMSTIIKDWNKESILDSIKVFYKINNRIPQARDFEKNIEYPSYVTVAKYFNTWNAAIAAAGFIPNLNNGFGNRITALDGVLYRSWYETEFVNKWLYNKEKYFYEVKYPDGLRMYDFYLPEKDLYIEIDGGLRPQVMEEKIAINKQLGRNLLVIKSSDINNFQGF